jgi:hypothetical protein
MLPSILLTPLVSESAGELEREPPVAHFNSRACSTVGLLQSLQIKQSSATDITCAIWVLMEKAAGAEEMSLLVQPS